MRLVIQRAKSGSVTVDGEVVGSIGHGLVVMVGFHQNDEFVDLIATAEKMLGMRIFSNEAGRFDLSVRDVSGGVLLVPQFTLFADTKKGRRPDFFLAMNPDKARAKFEDFVESVSRLHPVVATGVFGALMDVALVNDGPVTIIYDSPETQPA